MSERSKTNRLFVGRTVEMQALLDCVAEGARLVSIVGSPGIGKSRLARELAGQRGAAVKWLDPSGRDPRPVVDDRFVEALPCGTAPQMLIIDGANRCLDRGADAARRALDARDGSIVLVTSNAPLGLAGERVLRLGPLETETGGGGLEAPAASESQRLFFERACAVDPSFDPETADPEVLAEILHLLDGVPAAIEGAAKWMGAFGPPELLHLIRGWGPLLPCPGGAPSEFAERLAAEWARLEGREQRAMRRLCVFESRFAASAAAALLECSVGEALITLEALVRNSWVEREKQAGTDRTWYRVLRPIRALAGAVEAAPAEREQTRAVRARYVVGLARDAAGRLGCADAMEAMRELSDVRHDLLAVALDRDDEQAIAALVGLAPIIMLEGPYPQYLEILGEALRSRDVSLSLRAEASLWYARILRHSGDLERSAVEARRALEFAERAGMDGLTMEAHTLLGAVESHREALCEAEEAFSKAKALVEAVRGTRAARALLVDLAVHKERLGQSAAARSALDAALADARREGDCLTEVIALKHLSRWARLRGEIAAARSRALEALEIVEQFPWRVLETDVLMALLIIEMRAAEPERARYYGERAIARWRESGCRWGEGNTWGYLGQLDLAQGDLDGAIALLLRAAQQVSEVGEGGYASLFLAAAGAAHAMRDESVEAQVFFDQASQLRVADETLRCAAGLYRGHLMLAQIRRGQGGAALVEALLAESEPLAARSDEVRFAQELLRRELDALGGPILRMGERAEWLRLPNGSEIDLRRRHSARRLLERLLSAHRLEPGCRVSSEELFDAGWPNESIRHDSAANRLKVLVSQLRSLGLRPWLLTADGGYCFAPSLRVEVTLAGD